MVQFIFRKFYIIRNYKKILELISEKYNEHRSKVLGNEILYNLKYYNLIHRNGTCPTIYEFDNFDSCLMNESYEFNLY